MEWRVDCIEYVQIYQAVERWYNANIKLPSEGSFMTQDDNAWSNKSAPIIVPLNDHS